MPQDAYYCFYSENLALSYFDHPPMVAWMLWLFTSVLGSSITAIHITNFIITIVTSFVVYLLSKRVLSHQKAARATVLFISTILASIVSIITTPDVPLLLFWSLSLLFAHRAVSGDHWKDWLLTGVMMGAAFLSKYTAVFLPAGLFLFLLFQKEQRYRIFNFRFILVCIMFAAVASPVVIWNIQNDFISFRFQGGSRFNHMGFQLHNFFGTVGHQLFILVPVLFSALLVITWKYLKKGVKKIASISTDQLFLLCFFVPMVFFFFGVSVLIWVKINWMMPAYISGIILAATFISAKWIRFQLVASLILHFLGFVFIATYPVAVKSDDTWWGWQQLNDKVEILLTERPDYFVFAEDDYKTSAVLHFTSRKKVYAANVLGLPSLQYMIVDKDAPKQLQGKNALFLDSNPRLNDNPTSKETMELLHQHFESVIPIAPILLKNKRGVLMRKFWVYDCKGYKF
jgi:4-amino-4-deoxy-L-arabinose transferase-like glycosyltransferase